MLEEDETEATAESEEEEEEEEENGVPLLFPPVPVANVVLF